MLEKRFDDIQNERKYLAKVRKQKQRKLQKLNPLSRPQQNLGDQQDANHHSNGEDGTAQESYDPGQSEKTLKVPHTHPESQTKWDIIRDNLEVIRSYRNSKPLRLNSKWQIVQQNLPTILAMRKIEEQPNNMSNNEEKNSQPSGHESQVIIRKGRSSFNHFLETSFRRSQRMFTPLSISPIKNPRNNLLHSFLKSTIFTVRYLDDDELDLDSSDDKYIIPNSLPTLDESDPDSSLVYISSYWLMKFLSFSNPGPICNHDIACSHGYLKPHLHGCKKYICVPITVSLLLQIEKYLFEEFNYPLFSEQALGMKQINENDNHQYFRYLKYVFIHLPTFD